jgi:hypothetical protein
LADVRSGAAGEDEGGLVDVEEKGEVEQEERRREEVIYKSGEVG